MENSISVKIPTDDTCKIVSVKAASARMITEGSVIARIQNEVKNESLNITAPTSGQINHVCVKVGDCVSNSAEILTMVPCEHSMVIRDLCAECGADLQGTSSSKSASISIVHHVPELKVTATEADNIGKEDRLRLLKDKKLVLLVDLDHTLLHTTEVDVDPSLPGVHHYQLWGREWYHTKVRPHIDQFLQKAHELFELHVFTFGARLYAHTVTRILDPESKYFEHRIVSRDELFNPATKMGNVKSLFPCGDEMVCIIDDRLDVWNHAMNLIHVKPYIFFKEGGFIDGNKEESKKSAVANENQSESKTEDTNGKENVEEKQENDEPVICVESNMEEAQTTENKSNDKDTQKVDSSTKTENEQENFEPSNKMSQSDDEEEEHDEYLLHLEDILLRLHSKYFELYSNMCEGTPTPESRIPDLKAIIPELKRKVLAGSVIVFSGVIPTNSEKDAQCKHPAYVTARSLGAKISDTLSEHSTTHLVGASLDTDKVRQAKRMEGKIRVVSLDWLWCCAERWEWVDERLFPLVETTLYSINKKGVWRGSHKTYSDTDSQLEAQDPPAESADMPHVADLAESGTAILDVQMKEEMMDELEEFLGSESEDSDAEATTRNNSQRNVLNNSDCSSSSVESLSGPCEPPGWNRVERRRRKRGKVRDKGEEEGGNQSDIDKHSSLKRLCRPSDVVSPTGGEDSSDNSDAEDSYEESVGSVDEEMAEALDKELADRTH